MHLSMYMHTPSITCELNATLAEVARMMELNEVGSVVVMTEDNSIAGSVTDRDLVVRGLAHEGGPLTRVETMALLRWTQIGRNWSRSAGARSPAGLGGA